MGERQGYLIYADNHQVQRTLETRGLTGFLNEMSVSRQEELLNAVTGAFQSGSLKKSLFFMNFKYLDYAALQRGVSYRLPVYGVKGGITGLTRATNYVQAMLAKESELSGQAFNTTVFGGDYLHSEEITVLSAGTLIEAINRSGKKISNSIPADTRTKICCLAESVWHFQEINPRTRLVILLKNAEKRSCEILRQLYLLFPQKLRLQLGFETNIAREDLDAIDRAGGLPIYILTMEKSDYRDLSGYSFPVEVIDFDTLDEIDCNAERLNLLKSLAKNMSELNAGLFDHAEKKVIEGKEGKASSFKYYGEIVERMTSGELFWWTNRHIESVEQLKAMYDDQTYLMKVSDLKAEAIRIFYTEIYPKSNLASQVTQIAVDKKYKNRQELLAFLSDELYLKPQIKEAQNLKDVLDRLWEEELEKEKENSRRQIKAEHDKVAEEYEVRVSEAEDKAKKNKEEAGRLQQALKEKEQALEETRLKLENTMSDLEETRKGRAGLEEDEVRPEGENSISASDMKARKDKKGAKKEAQQYMIAAIATGILFAASAIFAVINMMNAGNLRNQLDAEKTRVTLVQEQLTDKTNENNDLKAQIDELTAERERLTEQIGGTDTGELEQQDSEWTESEAVTQAASSAEAAAEPEMTEPADTPIVVEEEAPAWTEPDTWQAEADNQNLG